MEILNKEIKLVIFDLDGTLIDSNDVWKKNDESFFSKRNMEVPKDYTQRIAHIGLKEAAIFTKSEYGIKESVEEILKEWNDVVINQYSNHLSLKDNAYNFIKYLKENNVKIALATANTKSLYEPCLKRLKIYDYFDFMADVDNVKSGKSSVKIYDLVSSSLNVNPSNTLVIEDICTCLKTAYENGYITVAMFDKHNKEENNEQAKKYSYKFIYDFKELM